MYIYLSFGTKVRLTKKKIKVRKAKLSYSIPSMQNTIK